MAKFAAYAVALAGAATSASAARGGASAEDAVRFAIATTAATGELENQLGAATGLTWDLVVAKTDAEAVQMVLDGKAEVAFPDSSAMLGKEKALQGLVAEVTDALNRTFYIAQAYVKKGSGITTFADLKGKKSCHTGLQKSAGTYMPIGYGVRNGFMVDHFDTLVGTITNYFTAGSCAAPAICGLCKDFKTNGECTAQDPYSDYVGALRCLSEGAGDVAFVRDTTVNDECGKAEKPTWCLAADQYVALAPFGNVPSHALVTKDQALTPAAVAAVKKGFTGLTLAANGPLLTTFGKNVKSFQEIPSVEQHMKDFSANLGCVPEIEKLMGLTSPLPCAADKPSGARTGTAESPIRWAYAGTGQAAEIEAILLAKTGLTFKVVAAKNDQDAVAKVVAGEADIAAPDTVAAIQKMAQLELVLAETLGSGRAYYNAVTWVKKDSGITSNAQLKGKRSCHTGFGKSAGMYVPMGHLIKTNQVPVVNNLKDTVKAYFSAGQCAVPELCSTCNANKTDGTCTTADVYSNYGGALRCLSEGAGDVAFAKDSTWDDICNVDTKPAWCLDKAAYVALEATGKVPSHPVVTKPGAVAADTLEKIKTTLTAISPSSAPDARFLKLLAEGGAQGYARGTTLQAHTSEYVDTLACVPDAANILAINSLPTCQKSSSSGSGSSSPATGSDTTDYDTTTRSIAVAALVLVCLAIVLIPIGAYMYGRRLMVDWIAHSQTMHQKQTDVESYNGRPSDISMNNRA